MIILAHLINYLSRIVLKFELAVLYLRSLFVCCRCVDVGIAEKQCYLHSFLLWILGYFSNIYSKLA